MGHLAVDWLVRTDVTATIPQLVSLLTSVGSDVIFHRESGGDPCPCRTPEGFRDPDWHVDNPLAPVCNEDGYLNVDVVEFVTKASIQPVAATRGVVRRAERASDLLGEIEIDDHIGIFPVVWGAHTLNFTDWDASGSDYIIYDGRRFLAVSSDKLPDIDGDPDHHFEVGLRLIKTGRPT